MVNIVVDACVARSSGGDNATYPIAIQCRKFLQAMEEQKHTVVMTKDIEAEWNKHQSNFAMKWRQQMVSKSLLKPISIEPLTELRTLIEALAETDKQREAITKDILLLEAALATDRRIVSLDEKTARKYFTKAAKEIVELQLLVWVNPSKQEEEPIEWLQKNAPADPERMLGYLG